MYNFILEIALMVSLGVMIYLIARAIPRVGDEFVESGGKSRLEEILNAVPLSKIDAATSNFIEKILRRIRLVLMRLDNTISGQLDRVKKFNRAGEKLGEDKPTLFTTNGNGNHKDSSTKDKNEG